MGYPKEKHSVVYAASPSTDGGPLSGTSGYASLDDFEKKDLTLKRRIRILRFVTRSVSLLLNVLVIGVMSYALIKYYLTRNHLIAGNVHPWVTPATLWPTYMLLGIATVTFFMNLITLCSYACGIGAANKVNSGASIIGYIMQGVHVIVWGVGMGLFRMAKTGKDLWGYSCSPLTDQIHAEVESFVDFGKLCTLQGGTWYIAIIETIVYLLTFIVTILMVRRSSYKKKMAKVKESMSMESGYYQNTELGTVYSPGAGKRYMPVAKESPHF